METEFPFSRIFLYFAGAPENRTTEIIKRIRCSLFWSGCS